MRDGFVGFFLGDLQVLDYDPSRGTGVAPYYAGFGVVPGDAVKCRGEWVSRICWVKVKFDRWFRKGLLSRHGLCEVGTSRVLRSLRDPIESAI